MRLSRALAAIGAAVAIGAAGCSDVEEPTAQPVATAAPAETFAPLVSIHPRDLAFPLSAARALRHSTLEWSGGPCPGETNVAAGEASQRRTGEGAPRLDPGRLAGRPRAYVHRPRLATCEPDPDATAFSTTDLTRPYARGGRPPDLPIDSGFNLDILLEAYPGERGVHTEGGQTFLGRVPAYYELRRERVAGGAGVRISYWLLFAWGETVDLEGERVSSNEGDWERVDALLERGDRRNHYVPSALDLYVDGRPRRVPWTELELASGPGGKTHPAVYLARDSHTPYAAPGAYRRAGRSGYDDSRARVLERAVRCPSCALWRTWRLLREASDQPWYGYRGGWGTRGLHPAASGSAGPMPGRVQR